MTYAIKIKKLREKLFVSQTELAKMLGVSFVTVSRWENNKFEPSLKIKKELSKMFIKFNINEEK